MRPTQRSAAIEKPRSRDAFADGFVCECRETDISPVALSHTTRPEPSRPLPKERLDRAGLVSWHLRDFDAASRERRDEPREEPPRFGGRATLRCCGRGSQSGTGERV